MTKNLERFVQAFPIILLLGSGLAFAYPDSLSWFKGSWITYSLGGIMLGMGLTLEAKDFSYVLKRPIPVILGTVLQFSIMPGLGFLLGKVFSLPEGFAIGLILVSACPGGTASNVITYLARADLALSVTLTTVSTILGIVMTPFLISVLVGNRTEVDSLGLIQTTFLVILIPVSSGLVIKQWLPNLAKRIIKISPAISVILITLIVSSILSQGKTVILSAAPLVFFSVFLLHFGGFGLGGLIAWILTKNKETAKTISIEVGMQNSGLGAVLARTHFLDPSTAIPSAVSSLTHSLIGSVFASYFRVRREK